MTDEKLDQPRNITLLPYQMQSGAPYQMQSGEILKQDTQFDILVCQDILVKRFALAKTPEESGLVIEDMERIHELDKKKRQLNYTQQSADAQLLETKQKAIFQRRQEVIASAISVVIGICFIIQALPLPGSLFLILALAKPLGHSLGEIGELFDRLTGFPKDSNKLLSNGNDQDIQSEEAKNARF
jgi:hypothetical protein